jgi:hypothetical protein
LFLFGLSFSGYKDGKKGKKKKDDEQGEIKKCTSSVRCYFICTESEDESYILSHKTVDQCRKLFMHIHTAPTLANYMKRFVIYLLSLTNHVCANGQRHLTGAMCVPFLGVDKVLGNYKFCCHDNNIEFSENSQKEVHYKGCQFFRL